MNKEALESAARDEFIGQMTQLGARPTTDEICAFNSGFRKGLEAQKSQVIVEFIERAEQEFAKYIGLTVGKGYISVTLEAVAKEITAPEVTK